MKVQRSLEGERELIKRACEGDGDAFAQLFKHYKPQIHLLCWRMAGNSALAEDYTQDVFLQLFRKLDTFRGESAFRTWLIRLTINVVLMGSRKNQRRKNGRPELSLDKKVYGELSGGFTSREYGVIDQKLGASVERIALLRAMEMLPPGCLQVFLLHEIEGYQHWEIAALLHCSIGNSKSQLHRARMRMRNNLKPVRRVPFSGLH